MTVSQHLLGVGEPSNHWQMGTSQDGSTRLPKSLNSMEVRRRESEQVRQINLI